MTSTNSHCKVVKRQASQTSKSPKKASPKKNRSQATKVEPLNTSIAIEQGDKPWYHVFTKGDAEYDAYMANEWGFEQRGDRALFEKVSLEGAQSGLSWRTILRKREAYRTTFHNFDPVLVATMTDSHVEQILSQPTDSPRDAVVRHKGKIQSVIHNAKCILQMRAEDATKDDVFDHFLWSFVDHKPILNRALQGDVPSSTAASEAMSKALKTRGFKFVGPTTCYAMMQAVGMVIDHPFESPEWQLAQQRLQERPGGYQDRTILTSRED